MDIVGSGHGNQSSNHGRTVCISHCPNTLGKGMKPTTFSLAMAKIIWQTRLFSLGMPTS